MTERKEKFSVRAKKFFKEIRLEMKKVIWPTKEQLIKSTLLVIASCFMVGIIIWIADAGLGLVFKAVFGQ